MDVFEGCNRVQAEVSDAPRICRRTHKRFVVKLFLCVFAIGFIAFFAYAPFEWTAGVRAAIKTVMCYDVFGQDVGVSAAVRFLINLFKGASA